MNAQYHASKVRLEGSEPQIKWANVVRKKKASDIDRMDLRTLALAIKPFLTEEDCKAMGLKTRAHAAGLVAATEKYMASCPSAAWWITHRDDDVVKWIEPSVKACIEHFKKTKPFK